jgi:8-amino-7-oxononanoate synthase
MEKVLSSTEAIINGRRMILAGTNNYMGLTFDPDCIEAATQAAGKLGTGTTGSRMANGTYSGHVQLERELADFYGCTYGVVFSTGYIANLGMLSSLTAPGDVLLIDADSHASIYDGCRLSGAEIIRFRHNDPGDLEKRLKRLGDRAANTLVVVEGIYSMLGDRAPLADIAAVKERYGAFLLVDEAHSLGVLGRKGRGLAEEAGFYCGNLQQKPGCHRGVLCQQSSRAGAGAFCQPAVYVYGLIITFGHCFYPRCTAYHQHAPRTAE